MSKPTLQEVVDFIKEASSPEQPRKKGEWCWTRNSRCKYVELVVDMRDGEFTILDRDRKKISFEDLKYQLERSNET